jgi:hypothetical protein
MPVTVIRWKSMRPIPQESSSLCWLAAYQMMFQWKGKPLDWVYCLLCNGLGQEGADKAYKSGLDRPDWPAAARTFGLTGVDGGDVSLDDITGLLGFGPLLVHGKFALGMHTIVVVGTDDDRDQVEYINPYWEGAKEVSARWSPFKWLHDGVLGNKGFAATMQHW